MTPDITHLIVASHPDVARRTAPNAKYVATPNHLRGYRDVTILVHPSYESRHDAVEMGHWLDHYEGRSTSVQVIYLEDD